MIDPISWAGIGTLASSLGGEAASAAGTAAAGSSWLPWLGGAAAGAGIGAGAASLLSGKGSGAGPAPQINIPAPPGVVPPQTPNAKPPRKSQQQSFLSGAAMAQQSAGAGTGTGKSLLGA